MYLYYINRFEYYNRIHLCLLVLTIELIYLFLSKTLTSKVPILYFFCDGLFLSFSSCGWPPIAALWCAPVPLHTWLNCGNKIARVLPSSGKGAAAKWQGQFVAFCRAEGFPKEGRVSATLQRRTPPIQNQFLLPFLAYFSACNQATSVPIEWERKFARSGESETCLPTHTTYCSHSGGMVWSIS